MKPANHDPDEFEQLSKLSPMPTAKEEWMAKYCNRLIERGGMDQDQALEYFRAGGDDHDYENDPVDSADEEMSYWDNDGEELSP